MMRSINIQEDVQTDAFKTPKGKPTCFSPLATPMSQASTALLSPKFFPLEDLDEDDAFFFNDSPLVHPHSRRTSSSFTDPLAEDAENFKFAAFDVKVPYISPLQSDLGRWAEASVSAEQGVMMRPEFGSLASLRSAPKEPYALVKQETRAVPVLPGLPPLADDPAAKSQLKADHRAKVSARRRRDAQEFLARLDLGQVAAIDPAGVMCGGLGSVIPPRSAPEQDEDCVYDEDGTAWTQTVGVGAYCQKHAYLERVRGLEVRLAEVKELYAGRYGEEVDAQPVEHQHGYDADGTMWFGIIGQGATNRQAKYEDNLLSLLDGLDEVKALYKNKYDVDVDEAPMYDPEGTPWVITVGSGRAVQRNEYAQRVSDLEDKLAEVKSLYRRKYGADVDEQEVEYQHGYDSEGTLWVGTIGQGAAEQQRGYEDRVDSLMGKLEEVKMLFEQKYDYGVDVDIALPEYSYDHDGTPWVSTLGAGVSAQRSAYVSRIGNLESNLSEVKQLFARKYGVSVDEEEVEHQHGCDADGALWVGLFGQGVAKQQEAYESRLDSLMDQLDEVKDMYAEKFAESVDESVSVEDQMYDEDGTAWVRIESTGVSQQRRSYNERVTKLENRLAEVKSLYMQKYDDDVDDVEPQNQHGYDADGTLWVGSVGQGLAAQQEEYENRIYRLEGLLEDVKALYRGKCGEDVGDDVEDDVIHGFDRDGTPWVITTGRGAASQRESYTHRMQRLDMQLGEVKLLYNAKYGDDIDGGHEHQFGYDSDGMMWVGIVGQGLAKQQEAYENRLADVSSLLNEVEGLYKQQFADFFDKDSSEVEHFYDQDGMTWVRTEGQGTRSQRQSYMQHVQTLDDQLLEVKQLFKRKYGEDVDATEVEHQHGYDSDGTLWVGTVGQGHTRQQEKYEERVDRLQVLLDEVKDLYEAKCGDWNVVDDADFVYDNDGTAWVQIAGHGVVQQYGNYMRRLSLLEEKLEDVKALYSEKYGEDVDAELKQQFGYDADGTMWFGVIGQGADAQQRIYGDRVDELLLSLNEVKALYRKRYEADVDDEEVEHQHGYDRDGTLWVGTTGQGSEVQTSRYNVRVDSLHQLLKEVKDLYSKTVGTSVDEESEPDLEETPAQGRVSRLKRAHRARQARRRATGAGEMDREHVLCVGPDGKVSLLLRLACDRERGERRRQRLRSVRQRCRFVAASASEPLVVDAQGVVALS
eukprot:TRINITY_DN45863_c0_g1_i1.p1 TRINITY_DN45863_c0_g1~~TRINITY_DN45863_c0_g1_i1.p1  ORF type:complete len:1229 (+),score=279.89 TRINITY_DN45863_c0_g1_i1:97-3687(+)